MDEITLKEQHKYETIWKSVPEYRVYSPADRCIPVFLFFYDQFQKGDTVLFTENCLWDLSVHLKSKLWILCFDVLEHIPLEKIESVLLGIFSRIQKGGFLSICSMEDGLGQIVNDKLHLAVQTADWWKKKISQFFCSHKELFNSGTILLLQITK